MKTIRALLLSLVVFALVGCQDAITDPTPIPGPDPTPSASATLIVANNASVSVFYMYISPCTNSTWGNDRLGPSETIPPGASRRWTLQPGCYDVRAEFSDRSYAEGRLQLNSGAEFTWRVHD